MSILVSIGANETDISNLQMTRDIISFVSSLLKSQNVTALLADVTYTDTEIHSLLNWYDDLLAILYNGGNTEDYSDILVPTEN